MRRMASALSSTRDLPTVRSMASGAKASAARAARGAAAKGGAQGHGGHQGQGGEAREWVSCGAYGHGWLNLTVERLVPEMTSTLTLRGAAAGLALGALVRGEGGQQALHVHPRALATLASSAGLRRAKCSVPRVAARPRRSLSSLVSSRV